MATAHTVSPCTFGGVNPVFRVADVGASIDYYLNKLGFKLAWQASLGFACVTRDRVGIFLCEGDQGHRGAWVWIGVSDVEVLHEEYRKSGARVRHPPANYTWAYEMQVEDLDGNVLRLGSDEKDDEPLGEWLDMDGVRWAPQPGGDWSRVE